MSCVQRKMLLDDKNEKASFCAGHDEMTEKMASDFRMRAFSSRPLVFLHQKLVCPLLAARADWPEPAAMLWRLRSQTKVHPLESVLNTCATSVSSPVKWVQ